MLESSFVLIEPRHVLRAVNRTNPFGRHHLLYSLSTKTCKKYLTTLGWSRAAYEALASRDVACVDEPETCTPGVVRIWLISAAR